ncbi:MAG: hypothetical protein WBC55_11290 [Dehalococcoidia bacterium]
MAKTATTTAISNVSTRSLLIARPSLQARTLAPIIHLWLKENTRMC